MTDPMRDYIDEIVDEGAKNPPKKESDDDCE